MWILYALSAALIWGINYAASGRVLQRGLSPACLFYCDLLFGLTAMSCYLAASGRFAAVYNEVRQVGDQWPWLIVAMAASVGAAWLSFVAIGAKNATLASLIEISYPFFVAFFAWLFFREAQLTWPTACGGALVLLGVGVIYKFS